MKEIKVEELEVKDLKTDFGNPRKIDKKGKEDLKESLESLGDFGLILIDEDNNIIAGNQRVSILKEKDEHTKVLCKRLIGYTKSELRAINVKDNTHAGIWDLEMLADWTADLGIITNIDEKAIDPFERKIDGMELIHYEKYDYVIIACRNEIDYNNLLRKFGIENAKVPVTKKRKIKARAVWYDDIGDRIIEKDKKDE